MSRNSIRFTQFIVGMVLPFVAVAIAGCAPKAALFPRDKLVGAGLEIDWTATQKGMAFLVEERRNRILKTQSMEEGEKFSFSVSGIDSERQFQTLFGVKFADARFSLYFIPEGEQALTK